MIANMNLKYTGAGCQHPLPAMYGTVDDVSFTLASFDILSGGRRRAITLLRLTKPLS
jgi:hypothetical protein